ncbi:MAG TPA: hypothetical protein VFN58_07075, partial [Candidatus Binatia bacterium]|nr:hypothetical protein [Candidatus Binatia bacterium]
LGARPNSWNAAITDAGKCLSITSLNSYSRLLAQRESLIKNQSSAAVFLMFTSAPEDVKLSTHKAFLSRRC